MSAARIFLVQKRLCMHALRSTQRLQRCQLSMSTPAYERFYTQKHEYISVEGAKGTVGITDYAQQQLGDVVYVELPEKDATLTQGDTAGAIESVKSASDVYTPVSGTITDVNTSLEENPSLINKSPYEKGWLYKIDIKSADELKDLLDDKSYADYCKNLDE